MPAARGGTDVPVRDAATVMLLRDAARGPQVLMVRRTAHTRFGAGKYVFPGGAVDDRDGNGAARLCSDLDDGAASRQLGVSDGGLAFWVAAVRECFEEAGLLLALNNWGRYPSWIERGSVDARWQRYRNALARGGMTFADVCAAEALHIASEQLVYLSHWITPPGPPRRYSARFFLSLAPPAQAVCVDGTEVVSPRWLRAAEALDLSARGHIDLMLPTKAQLEWLAEFDTASTAIMAARAQETVETVAPADAGDDAQIPIPSAP